MAIDYGKEEQIFNAGLDTAEYVANLRKTIHQEIDAGEFQSVRGKLWALNNELIGWYSRTTAEKNQKKVEELQRYEKMAFEVGDIKYTNKEGFEGLLRVWARVAIIYAHDVWLSKERDQQRSILS